MWRHWTVRTSTPYEPFLDFATAQWSWKRLREIYPQALGAVLMPNHLHLILPEQAPSAPLYGLLGGISKRVGVSSLWQPIPPPATIPDRHHLRRQLRYVALNPCRSLLCADPLEWLWSSYRDVHGATANPWVTPARLAAALAEPKRGFEVRFHAYVSGDPSVVVEGTPAPRPSTAKAVPEEPLIDILRAAAASLRISPTAVTRRGPLRPLFLHLAFRQGWTQTRYLAGICQVTPRAVQLTLEQSPPSALGAAALCLGDARLRLHANFAKREVYPGKPPTLRA